MPVSVNQLLANTLGLADPLGRIADDGRVGFNGRVNINGRPIRFAPSFDGTNDYGVLATRAINPDGDNTFEFWTSATIAGVAQSIISQNISATGASREFQLYISTAGFLEVIWGGSVTILLTPAQGYEPSKKYFISFVGTGFTVAKDASSNIVNTGSFTRGAAREPAAQTIIGARGNGAGLYSIFYSGIQRDVKINGVLWAMDQRNQTIQPSTPAGNNMTLVNVLNDRWQEVKQ